MKRLFYRPPDAWVGDLIPYWENDVYYGFYLHDPRKRDKEYAEMTTWHLIKTRNFVDVEYFQPIPIWRINDVPTFLCVGRLIPSKNVILKFPSPGTFVKTIS